MNQGNGKMYVDPMENIGKNNLDLQSSIDRLYKQGTYEDMSTIMIVPSTGMIPARVVQNWMGIMTPMNQKFFRIFQIGKEVGVAYQESIEMILTNPDLSKWKYILTVEHDNLVPPNCLIQLIESINGKIDGNKYDAVGGLYWTKSFGSEIYSQPMCYGDPKIMPRNFIPQIPIQNGITPCNGLGMGCTLFRLDMFKDERFQKPFFKTEQSYVPGQGAACFTQDLYFFHKACELGYKFACDSRVLVGHLDINSDIVW